MTTQWKLSLSTLLYLPLYLLPPPPIAMSSVETQKLTGSLSGSLPLLEDLESSFGS